MNINKEIVKLYEIWYEAPFGSRNHEHFDAVVFDKITKSIFIVESKRLTVPKHKLVSIGEDIQSFVNKNNIHRVTEDYCNISADNYNVYGVILADVWTETSIRTEIFNNWGASIQNTYASELNFDSEAAGFSETLTKYKLLIMIFKKEEYEQSLTVSYKEI